MLVVFLGPPGAGKGTQAARLAAKYGLPQVSTGDLLREAVAAGSELGRRVKAIMEAGGLVDDDTMGEVVRERLARADAAGGAIMDGYPRTCAQAKFLDRLLRTTPQGGVDLVLFLDVPEQMLIDRLSRRRACPECGANYHLDFRPPLAAGRCDRCGAELIQRDDDREQVVRQRLAVYRESTEPLVAYYRDRGVLREIDGTGTIDEVFARVDAAMAASVAG